MIVKADFHLHSCLSPCGDLEMSPSVIASVLRAKGVRLAALTDHNSALNCPAFAEVCLKEGIAPVFGLEVQTTEEVHVLCLFAELDNALSFGEEIYALMPDIPNNPEKLGDQVYVDADENIIGEVEKYLITSADIQLEKLAERVLARGGLVIPAHVDRAAFSLSSQLGFIPDGPWSALEAVRMPVQTSGQPETQRGNPLCISARETTGFPALIGKGSYALTTSSDAHYIEHIARRAFDLDIGDCPLVLPSGVTNVEAIREGLSRRPHITS